MTARLFIAAAVAALAVSALLGWSVSPALAHHWHHGHGPHWRAIHGAIYEQENRIAFLEADPEIDDGYKAPIITGARHDVRWLRAKLPPAHGHYGRWASPYGRWASPCCYSRRPIHIR